jgi:hypothetical protein
VPGVSLKFKKKKKRIKETHDKNIITFKTRSMDIEKEKTAEKRN